MTDKRDDLPACEQFPIIEPDELREALALLRIPKGWEPGRAAAVVTVELSASQAQFLAARGKRRFGLIGDAAIKREIEAVISLDVMEGRRAIYRRFGPWLDLIQRAKIKPDVLERLRKATRGK